MSNFVHSLLGNVAQVVRNAFQVVNNELFNFPECSLFLSTDRLSIKLENQQLHALLKLEESEMEEDEIIFLVRDEVHGKQTIAYAHFNSSLGFVLVNRLKEPIMLVVPALTNNALGILMHPSQFILYKILRITGSHGFMIVRNSTDEPVVRIQKIPKVMIPFHTIGKAVGLLDTSYVYLLTSSDGQTNYGHIRPKLILKSSTLVVKFFASSPRNEQLRATMIGAALLLIITKTYPGMRTLVNFRMFAE